MKKMRTLMMTVSFVLFSMVTACAVDAHDPTVADEDVVGCLDCGEQRGDGSETEQETTRTPRPELDKDEEEADAAADDISLEEVFEKLRRQTEQYRNRTPPLAE